MVSLAQMTVAGLRRLPASRSSAPAASPTISLGWPWWLAVPFALLGATRLRRRGRLALGAHRGHLHDHDHARRSASPSSTWRSRTTRVFNGFQGFSKIAAPDRARHRLARAGAVLLRRARLRAGRLLPRQAPGARAVRRRAAGHPRQPAPHGTRSATTSPRTASRAYAVAGLLAAVGGVLMVWYNGRISPGTVNTRRDDQHPDHRRARRHEAPDRRLHRRDRLRAAAELRDRPVRSASASTSSSAACSSPSSCFPPTVCSGCGRSFARAWSDPALPTKEGDNRESDEEKSAGSARSSARPPRRRCWASAWAQETLKIGLLANARRPVRGAGPGRHAAAPTWR